MSSSKKHSHGHEHGKNKHQDAAADDDHSQLGQEPFDDEARCGPDAETPAEQDELEQDIAELAKEKEEFLDRLQRTMAEFDNYRRRVSREKEDLLKYGSEKMARDLLPVADNFERALEQAKEATDPAAVVEGIEMIYKQFLAALEKYNVIPFDSLGEPFDPEKHEAMAQQKNPDFDENTIMAELQKGYVIGDRLLRPARVVVSQGQDESCESETEQ